MIEVGQKVPSFKLPDEEGKFHTNKDYLGKRLLIYFYPKDFTPGCTKEACGFRDNYEKLKSKVEIVGISKDSVERHKKFKKKYELPFILLSDPEGVVIKKFGADGIILPKRTSFLVDSKGVIAKIYEKVSPGTHADEILNELK